MMKQIALAVVALAVVGATAKAQPPAPGRYDPSLEASYGGVVTAVVSAEGRDGTVGVHLNLKTANGAIIRVEVGPAMFIGMNNFWFLADDVIQVTGAYVSHDGDVALWARQVSKAGKTLALRGPDGTPRWPVATADDPDGCGVAHDRIR